MNLDISALTAGIRTAGALLIGNSVLIFTGVLGATVQDATTIGLKVFFIGLLILILASITTKKEVKK